MPALDGAARTAAISCWPSACTLPGNRLADLARTQASAVCYTIVGGALSAANVAQASIPNHSGMGIVEEVGPLAKRVQKGDRVVVPGTPQCGVCYQCLHGRADS